MNYKPHPLTKEELTKLYVVEGKSVTQTAKELGTSTVTVCKYLRAHGIKARAFSTKGLKTRLGAKLSDETKEKIAAKHRGKKLSPEHRAKVLKTLVYGQRGSENPIWRGGRVKRKDGYVLVRAVGHPDASPNGYIREHRLVMEKVIGRRLYHDEHVHHLNEDKSDNRPENLELLSNSEHMKRHWETGRDERVSNMKGAKRSKD